MLLLFPETRIVLAAHEEKYAAAFGAKVKDVIDKFGREAGITIRADTKSKSEWVIEKYGGGMVCKGMHGGIVGRPADLFLIDDPLKGPEQALSPTILENQFNWFDTVATGRLRGHSSIVVVTTRWTKKDLVGRILDKAKKTKEAWKLIKFHAIAKEGDILGREPGAALWEENVPLRQLLLQQTSRWWSACWQQEPQDEEGTYFKPKHPDGSWRWPLYHDMTDSYSLEEPGGRRIIYPKQDVIVILMVDWAYSKKTTADYTAFGVFGVCPGGQLLALEVTQNRFRIEEFAPNLAACCARHRPALVAVEVGHPTFANEYRRFSDIPEVRWLQPKSKSKLVRALPAIILAENRRLYVPADEPPWLNDFAEQAAGFDGLEQDHDDMVDTLGYGASQAEYLRPVAGANDAEPEVLTPGRIVW